MAPSPTTVRVRYAETDQMGVVYHSNYFLYFEVGRTDYMRQIGLPYRDMEAAGAHMVVVETSARFRAPARYDDVLVIETRPVQVTAVRVTFEYRIRREGETEVLVEGSTVLACLGDDMRPRRLPPALEDRLLSRE